MRFIAHRGNCFGPNKKRENREDYLLEAIFKGFDVEVDIWIKDGDLFLGHDSPEIKMSNEFLAIIFIFKERLWIHCKNLEALLFFSDRRFNCLNFFFHQNDDFALTSQNFIWTYPDKPTSQSSIMLKFSPIDKKDLTRDCFAICGDDFSHVFNGA